MSNLLEIEIVFGTVRAKWLLITMVLILVILTHLALPFAPVALLILRRSIVLVHGYLCYVNVIIVYNRAIHVKIDVLHVVYNYWLLVLVGRCLISGVIDTLAILW